MIWMTLILLFDVQPNKDVRGRPRLSRKLMDESKSVRRRQKFVWRVVVDFWYYLLLKIHITHLLIVFTWVEASWYENKTRFLLYSFSTKIWKQIFFVEKCVVCQFLWCFREQFSIVLFLLFLLLLSLTDWLFGSPPQTNANKWILNSTWKKLRK